MTTPLESAIVRIRAANGSVAGTGFLVTGRHVLTCAHVVTGALGLPGDAQVEKPGFSEKTRFLAHLDFPLLAPESVLTALVSQWQPSTDVAVLELTTDPPAESKPVRLVTADDLWGHFFRAFGFPSGYDDGVWTSGVLRGRTAAGWVQVEDVKVPGYWVQPGFSGTPVWDEQLGGVVGMAVAADTDRATKAAFMIPARELIEAWPEMAETSLEAGSLGHLQMQLAQLEQAQRKAADPSRFQPQIDALEERIATWDGRVERQRERIAEGLEKQRRQMVEKQTRRKQEHLRVVGRPPLDVADYFKNRQWELEKLGQLLAQPTTRLVSVIGHGGMGKTALACKVLQDLECHRWPYTNEGLPLDGIAYLSTRTAGISLERLFLDCAKLLGGDDQDRLNAVWTNPQLETQEKIARLLDALSAGRYVILLDNLEDLLDDQGQLTDDDLRLFFEQSLMASQGAQLMVTSRVALAFRREVMRFDRQVKLLEGLPVEDGVALLRELDPNGDYGLRDAPEGQLDEAVELTHGVPRALEVLAGILANDPFAALDEVLETFYEQKDVVQALIEENYKRLDRDARRVIEALAVFKRPVPPLAVDYLLEPFAPGLDVPGILRRLTHTNIVSVDRTAKTVTLHPIDQDYAYSQLPDEESTELDYTRQALERRAADYYVQLRTTEETWKSIEDLEPQLNEFRHLLLAQNYERAATMLEPIDAYLTRWGHYERLIRMRSFLLGKLKSDSLVSLNSGRLGSYWHYLGQTKRAIELYSRALDVACKGRDRQSEGHWLAHLGTAYRFLGQFNEATKFYRKALLISRETSDRLSEGAWLNRLGVVYQHLGQFEVAISLLKEGIAITSETGDDLWKDMQFGYLGQTYIKKGELQIGVEFCGKALSIARRIGHRKNESMWLDAIASVHHNFGFSNTAIELCMEALSIARDINYRYGEATSLLLFGRILLGQGRDPKAKSVLEEALSLGVQNTNYWVYLYLSTVSLTSGRQTDANVYFGQTVDSCHSVLDKTPNLYEPRYVLATALVGQAVCDPHWADESQRPDLLAPALAEYRRALAIAAAPGVVQDAIRDLEMIRAAGIEGLEPVFELLENAEYEPDLPEDLPDIVEDVN